jgi:hypothetical protein
VRVIDWNDWLDQHIPYYEVDRFRTQYRDRPPCVVLEIDIFDRVNHGAEWREWEFVNARFEQYETEPLFLERDTRQKWYWAFWNNKEALLAVIVL